MKGNALVFMSNYWHGGDTGQPSGKLAVMFSERDQEKRDGKVGLEPMILSCDSDLVQKINKDYPVPCVMELEYSIKNASSGVTFHVYGARPAETTANVFPDLLQDLLSKAEQELSGKKDSKPSNTGLKNAA